MNRALALAVVFFFSGIAVSRADNSWIDFAGSYVNANAPANAINPGGAGRLILLPGREAGQYIGQMSAGTPCYLAGAVDGATLRGTALQIQNRNQFDFTITSDGKSLNFSAGGTQMQFVPETPAGGQQIAPQGQPQNVPAWLTPGTRLVFHTRTAQITTGQYAQWPDPGAEVQVTVDKAPQNMTNGISFCDILAVPGPQSIGLTMSMYLVIGAGQNGQPVLSATPMSGGVRPIMAANMVDPGMLANLKDTKDPQHTVAHCDYPLNGKTRAAINVLSKFDKYYMDQIFDLKSGVCLHSGETSASEMLEQHPGRGGAPGESVSRPAVLLGLTDLVNVRQVHTPWSATPIPQSLRGVRCMVYQGTSVNAQIRQTTMATSIMKFHDTTDALLPFLQYSFVQFQPMGGNIPGVISGPMMSQGLTASTSLNPYAIDPAVLQGLQVGQVIDEEPAIGYKTSVVFVGQSDGRNVVVISEASETNPQDPKNDSMYDVQSGLLIRQKSTTQMATTDMRLVGAD
jgi:hypothetical protein